MIENNNHIHKILEKEGRGEELTQEESTLLEQLRSLPPVPMDEIWEDLERRIAEDGAPEIPYVEPRRHQQIQYIKAAAVYIILLGPLLYLLAVSLKSHFDRQSLKAIPKKEIAATSIRPRVVQPSKQAQSSKQAVLTRYDNSVLILDTMAVGSAVPMGPGLAVRKVGADQLVYESSHPIPADSLYWNRLTVGAERNPFTIRLPDRSRVQLKPGGDLKYPLSREQSQYLELTGEALFDVMKNSRYPMRIATYNGMNIEELGTVFRVKARAGDKIATVSLISGALRVHGDKGSLYLKPGGEIVSRDGRLSEHALKDETGLFEWSGVPEEMRFSNEELDVAVQRIASWYRLKVINPDNIKGIPVTGVLHLASSPEDILKEMEHVESGAVWLNIKGNTVTISGSSESK